MHQDHLGSITAITNEAGNEVESFSFDAWGKRRAATLTQLQNLLGTWNSLNVYEKGNLTIPALTLASATTDRGFTGHQQMDEVNLIHMGGRVYDAEIGRFLSADPFVRDTTNLQALNRYTYVENNPLSYTDPSGYFLKKLVKGVGKAIKSVVSASVKFERDLRRKVLRAVGSVEGLATIVSIALNFIPGCQGWCMMLVQAAHSAAMTDANGGTISHALQAGAIAFARAGLQQVGGGTNFGSNDGGQMVFQLDTAAKSVGLDSAGSLSKDLAISVGVARLQVAEQKAQAKGNRGRSSVQERNFRITDEQQRLAASGNVQGFWESRSAMGDPVAKAGLASLEPSVGAKDYLFGGTSINNRLQAFSRVYGGTELDIGSVRIDLMHAHIAAVTKDTSGILGLLNPQQIAGYHHQVFGRYGLPSTAFGGTPFTGGLWEADATRLIWCRGCDWK